MPDHNRVVPKRVFIPTDRPLLPQVVDRLLPRQGQGPLRLDEVFILCPTRQSGRRLREALTVAWRQRGGTALLDLQVAPPTVLFQRELPSTVAHEFDWLAAWKDVLMHRDPSTLPALLPQTTAPLNATLATSYGRRLQHLRETLFEAGLDLGSTAVSPALIQDQARWRELAELEVEYRALLRSWGLMDVVDAKQQALAHFTLPENTRLILAGVPDPTPVVLHRLKQLDGDHACEVWIHADESLADTFDEWGRPTAAWEQRKQHLQVPSREWIESFSSPDTLVRRMADVARQALEFPDLALGLLETDLSPALSASLRSQGCSLYDPSPVSLEFSPVYRLLNALEDQRRRNDPESLRAIWRQPDLLQALDPEDPSGLLREWERYASTAYPENATAVSHTIKGERLLEAWNRMLKWLAREDAEGWLMNLQEIYAEHRADPSDPDDRFLIRQVQAASAVLQEAARKHQVGRGPSSSALLETLSRTSIDPLRVEGTFTAEGWLELLYHPAPQVLLIGVQEGKIPAAVPRDPLLPRQLREDLGLPSDRDWLARDLYLFHCLHSCRAPGAVRAWVLKHSREGNPQMPSRILFACDDQEVLERIELLFSASPDPLPVPPPSSGIPLHPDRLPQRNIDSLSVSDVNLYLACPTRFYLQVVLGMNSVSDEQTEPDAAVFGTLIHSVLERVVREGACNQPTWNRRCESHLQQQMEKHLGPLQGMSQILLQHSALKRLRAAGTVQLQAWEEGWVPVMFEQTFQRTFKGITLIGKVDRIDRHPVKGYRILDYKTSETPAKPTEMHVGPPREGRESIQFELKTKIRQWKNLQLPLYRWLTQEHLSDAPVEVLYFNLPASVDKTGLSGWPDEPGLIHEAETCLGNVLELIQKKVWTPTSIQSPPWDPFRVLLESGTEWIPSPLEPEA